MSQPDESGEFGGGAPRRPEDGLPDHHNPLGGVGGAAPARSALSLRLGLAVFGLVVSVAGAITLAAAGVPLLLVTVLAIIAVTAAIDIVIVLRRKFRGEPG